VSGSCSLYFHIPFCTKKCPYCHFYVLPNLDAYHTQLLEALAIEWQKAIPLLKNQTIVSIYFGGGTPSLFGPLNIQTILQWIQKSGLAIDEHCEITLEANPESFTRELARDFFQAGINRLSLGVQSLDSSSLLTLGREHNANQAILAIENAALSGIKNISIDLMYDLPSQTEESWKNTLSLLKDLPISHLSLYNLTIEPNTVFFKKRKELTPLLPTMATSLSMLQSAVSTLEEIGLLRYEVSAFAKSGFHSIHNTGYWTARPFLGFGPSAFSYWDKKRFRNSANLSKYAAALKAEESPVDFSEKLPYPSDIAELLAIELRLLKGVDSSSFERQHGLFSSEIQESLKTLVQRGWLKNEGPLLQLTAEGLLFYDSVAEEIILPAVE